MLADVSAQQGDLAGLQQYAPLAEKYAGQLGHTLYQAIAHRAWGVLHRLHGEYAESAARLQQALHLFQTLKTRWQIGRTFLEFGHLAASSADPLAARAYYVQAQQAFEEMGALPAGSQVQEYLTALD
jgi:hypothetical protein